MNKKILVGLLSFSLLATGCATKDIRYIHSVPNNECYELVGNIYANDSGVAVEIKGYGELYFSAGTYIIVHDKCPICNKELSESE